MSRKFFSYSVVMSVAVFASFCFFNTKNSQAVSVDSTNTNMLAESDFYVGPQDTLAAALAFESNIPISLAQSAFYTGKSNAMLTASVKVTKNYQVVSNTRTISHGTGQCPAKHDKPGISKRKNYNHMDEDCCPDFDEWPNPGCAYSAKGYSAMLAGPTPGHVHRH